MGLLCWLFGHRELEDFNKIDFAFIQTKRVVSHKKQIGTVDIFYKMSICKRCQVLYNSEIDIKDNIVKLSKDVK